MHTTNRWFGFIAAIVITLASAVSFTPALAGSKAEIDSGVDAAMAYLDRSSGWEIGVGPAITIVDEGVARSLSTTTAKDGIYAFFFDQKGLMAGAGLQGSKITRNYP